MSRDLEKLENPTLHLKVQKAFASPWNGGLRKAATSGQTISRLKPGANIIPLFENDGYTRLAEPLSNRSRKA